MSNNSINFSIVITTYNRCSLLKRAIDSALTQTAPCEVVVVDDCSTDGTEDYCRHLGSQIIYYRNSSNLGHSATVNAGVKIAKGNWIKLLDDDDYLISSCIEEMSKAIEKHPQAVICSGQAIIIDGKGKEMGKTRQRGQGKAFYIPQEDIHYGMLIESLPFGTASQIAFRRDVFLKTGGWDSRLDVSVDDVDSCAKIAQFGNAIFINHYIVHYTVWQGGYARRLPLGEWLNRHILLKKRIYELVDERHRQFIPDFENMKGYLRLHWGFVALKRGRIPSAVTIAFPAVFSCEAWKLLLRAFLARQRNYQNPHVRKIVLF